MNDRASMARRPVVHSFFIDSRTIALVRKEEAKKRKQKEKTVYEK